MAILLTACGTPKANDTKAVSEPYASDTDAETEPSAAEPYSADYDECLDRAAEEKAENIRPELIEKVENIGDYDTVFLGFPNWWYSAPMAVFSFLEENDLTGKKVVLFCSHGTGGLASSGKDISAVLTNSQVESNVLGVYRDDISESQEKINDWLKEIGY